MNKEEMKRYESFKQKFFHWFLAFQDDRPFSAAAGELLALLKEELALEQAVFYLYDPVRAAFYPEAAAVGTPDARPIAADGERKVAVVDAGGPHMAARLFFMLSDETPAMVELVYRKDGGFDERLLWEIRTDLARLFRKLSAVLQGEGEEKRYGQLHHFAAKIHSSMHIDVVLEEIIRTLQNVYPSFTYHLLLSHDNHLRGNLPIKTLVLDEREKQTAALRAFLRGSLAVLV